MSTFHGFRPSANPQKTDPISSASHPNERILTFMIEQTDASKQSDERQVKNRCSTNLLTQKKTGGRHIMGNQGTTSWKLGAFFVISLMLIAGLFSNAAMAASGDGMVTYELQNISDAADHTFVPVGYKGFNLTFKYVLPGTSITDAARKTLAKGEVKIQIPAGWTGYRSIVKS